MSHGHGDTHSSAGPTGITLNELHVASPCKTTETFSISDKVGGKSALTKELNNRQFDAKLQFGNVRSSVGFLIFYSALYWACQLSVEPLFGPAGWLALPSYLAPTSELCRFILALLMAAIVVAGLELTKGLQSVRDLFKFSDLRHFGDDFAYSDRIKPKAADVHFGKLRTGYYVSDTALVVRSLNDRLVTVISASMIRKVARGTAEKHDAWRGREKTLPIVVTLEFAGYESTLIIHGAHFEAPGQDSSEAEKKAAEFCKAIKKLIHDEDCL